MPGETQGGGQRCGAISAREYDFKRTISLPNRNTLEQLIRSKVQGVDDEVKKRLNKGCKCCETRSPSCGSLAYLYCNIEDCKSGWALQCLHNTARIAACYTVEFNYRESAPPVLPQPVPAPAEPAPAESALPEEPMVPLAEQCVAAIEERKTHLRRFDEDFPEERLVPQLFSGISGTARYSGTRSCAAYIVKVSAEEARL
ncbi:hypothetical protein ANCCEY_05828 [Ancylostoma ceylanicum]|uniref:Uncharacterized protein n=1 Tax=Ancylostoma ceylanicum TaxID=53326 RepID=A0A0D6LSR0_9BILA|nr:hypothetical protein ANCCEY_05828 [Ancylostoma ceylanicum]